jgi:hypothetical protein
VARAIGAAGALRVLTGIGLLLYPQEMGCATLTCHRNAQEKNSTDDSDSSDPCDKMLSNALLKEKNIKPHVIKRDILGKGKWGAYNLCGCKDGRVILKRSQDCKGPGGDPIEDFWK